MLRRAWAILLSTAEDYVADARRRLHSEFQGHVEAKLRDKVEAEVRERVRIQTEDETIRRVCAYLQKAPGMTKDGYVRMIKRGAYRGHSWDGVWRDGGAVDAE